MIDRFVDFSGIVANQNSLQNPTKMVIMHQTSVLFKIFIDITIYSKIHVT